jgi:hypothetical protein
MFHAPTHRIGRRKFDDGRLPDGSLKGGSFAGVKTVPARSTIDFSSLETGAVSAPVGSSIIKAKSTIAKRLWPYARLDTPTKSEPLINLKTTQAFGLPVYCQCCPIAPTS